MLRKPLIILAIAVKDGRPRWPFLSRLIARAHGSRWAPRALGEFDDPTNPAKMTLATGG